MNVCQPARSHNQSAIPGPRECCNSALDLAGIADIDRTYLHPERRRCGLDHGKLSDAFRYRGIAKDSRSRYLRRNLPEQLQPFCARTILDLSKPRGVAARSRQALYETGRNGIGGLCEYDRNRARHLQQRPYDRAARGQDDLRRHPDQFHRIFPNVIGSAGGPAYVNVQVVAHRPTEFLQTLQECCEASLSYRVICSNAHERAEASSPFGLLPARRNRPCRCCAAEQRDELAARDHSITSSARASSASGTVRPSALAVVRLMTRSNLVGCSIGRSAGLAPRNILSTKSAARRKEAGKLGP